jgi:hypothetical protein
MSKGGSALSDRFLPAELAAEATLLLAQAQLTVVKGPLYDEVLLRREWRASRLEQARNAYVKALTSRNVQQAILEASEAMLKTTMETVRRDMARPS